MKADVKLIALALLLLLCGAAPASGQAVVGKGNDGRNTGLLYGPGYVFSVAAPKDWVLDEKSGARMGARAVFYPEGSSWAEGRAVMYVNTYYKRDPAAETLESVIAGDVAAFKQKSEKLKVVVAPELPTRKEKKAAVRYFEGDQFNNFEAVAYLDEGKVVVMLVLTARSKKEFEGALPAFAELVGSYLFLGDKIVMPN